MNKSLNLALISILGLILSVPAFGQSHSSLADVSINALQTYKRYVRTDLFYTHDYISNTGGAKAGPRNIGALDIYFESDFSKFSSLQGQVQFHYIHIHHNDQRGAIGDIQFASNIDVPVQVDRVGDLWYQQNWSDHFNTLVGFHDISMEFDITESSLTFLNSSFGTDAGLAYAGTDGPSIYPITSLGTRSLYHFSEELSIRVGLYDANPGGEDSYRSFHSDVGAQNGLLHISELAYQDDDQKIGLGGWNHSKEQAKIGTDETTTHFGSYSFFERKLSHSLRGFIRYGWSNPLANIIQSNTAFGMTYRGLFQRKKTNDEMGIGLTNAHFSHQYIKQLGIDEESETNSSETAYELFYQFKPIKHLSLRPDVQYITTPSGLKNFRNAWATGIRSVIEI